ncbi:hypothetical protein BgiBS90_036344 [Biomphalaria glabrata]|nr:hypothetical protein BgiBS90_036344 [Biomphalaria glabrata]
MSMGLTSVTLKLAFIAVSGLERCAQGEEGVTKKLKLVEAELAKLKIKYAVSYLTNFMELEHSQAIKNKQLKQAKDNRKMALNKKNQTIELLKRELQELRKATNN